jgi:hypothetical protein
MYPSISLCGSGFEPDLVRLRFRVKFGDRATPAISSAELRIAFSGKLFSQWATDARLVEHAPINKIGTITAGYAHCHVPIYLVTIPTL